MYVLPSILYLSIQGYISAKSLKLYYVTLATTTLTTFTTCSTFLRFLCSNFVPTTNLHIKGLMVLTCAILHSRKISTFGSSLNIFCIVYDKWTLCLRRPATHNKITYRSFLTLQKILYLLWNYSYMYNNWLFVY